MTRALPFWQRLFSWRREAAPILPAAPQAPDWLPEHQRALQQFLGSPAGRVLMARGRAVQFQTAAAACADVFHTSHSAGAAKGFGEALDWLESLSCSSRAADEAGPAQGQTDTAPPGEAEFRELMSP